MGILRLYLALSVAFAHSINYTGNNFLFDGLASVKVFFLISGFIITYVLSNKYKNSVIYFYKVRFLRIFIPFIIVSIIIEISYFIWANYPRFLFILVNNFSIFETILVFFSNIFLFGSDLVAIISSNNNSLLKEGLIIPQSWSLPLELYFYLLSPFIINKRFLRLILFFISLILYLILFKIKKINYIDFSFFPNLFIFILGIFSCKLMFFFDLEKKFKLNLFIIKYINSIFLIMLSVIFLINFLNFEFDSSDRINMVIYVFIISFLLPIFFCVSSNLQNNLKKIDIYSGHLSYYVYLTHVFVYLVLIKLNFYFLDTKILYFFTLLFFTFVCFIFIDPIEKKVRTYLK